MGRYALEFVVTLHLLFMQILNPKPHVGKLGFEV